MLRVWSMLMYTLVPAEMLGRVTSVDWFVSIGLTPVSFALTGPIADAVGARATLAGAGVLGLLTVLVIFIPGVRDPERTPLPDGRARLGSAA
jgi:DHA3 family tetracycline resistance protein-like MFS transporter